MKKHSSIVFFCIALFGHHTLPAHAFESKWDRVLDLGQAIKAGSVGRRLETKNQILDILLAEETGYPVYYVDQNATGTGDGSSWENAFTDVQPAIEAATETEGWVWVAKGNYLGTYPYSDGAIKLKSRVILLGGFQGNETHIDQRNFQQNETIIRGWRGRRAVDMEHLITGLFWQ